MCKFNFARGKVFSNLLPLTQSQFWQLSQQQICGSLFCLRKYGKSITVQTCWTLRCGIFWQKTHTWQQQPLHLRRKSKSVTKVCDMTCKIFHHFRKKGLCAGSKQSRFFFAHKMSCASTARSSPRDLASKEFRKGFRSKNTKGGNNKKELLGTHNLAR